MAALLALALVWSYWTTLGQMVERWAADPQYSHAFLVPLFGATVLWFRRERLARASWTPSLYGLPLIVGGLTLRLYAIRMDLAPVDAFSVLPVLAGMVLFVGGRGVLAWSWPAIAFLAFMLPLPFTLEVALAHPLRRLATLISTYLLRTLGYPALSEGNIIVIDQMRLGIVDACSGLGMLMTFFALAAALVMVIQAPLLERLVLIVSAIPIAIFANVIRITATAMAYYGTNNEAARKTMHDAAGWFMMPLALVMFWLVLRFLDRAFPPDDRAAQRPLPLFNPAAAPEKTPTEQTASSRP